MTTLVRSGRAGSGDLDDLHGRLTELDALLVARAAEIGQVKAELAAFKNRYRAQVGLLHEELDDLERAIAEAELGEMARHAPPGPAAAVDDRPVSESTPLPRYTSDAVRRLFRDVAKAIHPDLAQDELARQRRHALMVEANQAYAEGDEQRLRWVLQAWESSPEAVPGDDPEAARLRLVRRIEQLEQQLAQFADELASLHASPMWRLKTMIDEAAAQGRDLVREMVGRLKLDVMTARNRLAAIQWTP